MDIVTPGNFDAEVQKMNEKGGEASSLCFGAQARCLGQRCLLFMLHRV
jgi:hypothetical protein